MPRIVRAVELMNQPSIKGVSGQRSVFGNERGLSHFLNPEPEPERLF